MSKPWHVKRTVIARQDGQRRWDYAYQFRLLWVLASEAGSLSARSNQQEDANERRRLCPRFGRPSTPSSDD